MKWIPFKLVVAVIVLLAARSTLSNPVSAAQQTRLDTAAQQANVIVILRDQLTNVPPARRSMGARMSALAASQSPLIAQLQGTRARSVHQFSTINAFATAVSPLEATALAANPLVQAVVPDRAIALPRRNTAAKGAPAIATSPRSGTGLCDTLEPEALELTHAAFLSASAAQAPRVVDGRGRAITGQGVKVAFLADRMDPTLQGFIRPDGSPVFIDYQDFSGDAADTPAGDGEGFGAASAIAAQDMPNGKPLLFDISKFVNPAHPLPAPCNIRIRGIAPGASLVGLDVVSSLGLATTSSFVQAIEYAVVHDDVDVINEPFGGNPVPETTEDPISLANDAAVSAGVTVVVGTGDSGPAGTLGASATRPDVIAVGTSTAYRIYEQISYGAQALAKGYLSNNISSLSSGGFAQRDARTVDVVAPGDLSWSLCSTNLALYGYCTKLTTAPKATPIQAFGGSGEASPITAGEAALVIQAYRISHAGADPTPAVVKQIIMSSATDLGAPPSEQGAGLINALLAVETALSDGNRLRIFSPGSNIGHSSDRAVTDINHDLNPILRGFGGLLYQPNSARITDAVNSRESLQFDVSNTGFRSLRLTPALQVLGAPIAGASLPLTLTPAIDPTFVGPTGARLHYITQQFEVPAGAHHLDAAIAYRLNSPSATGPGPPPGIVSLALLDPRGRQVAYSLPQNMYSGYGRVDVVKPLAGTWTALIWTGPPGNDSYTGAVQFSWSAENFVTVGAVSPASLILAAGATETLTVRTPRATQPGDLAAAIRFDQRDNLAAASFAAIPVSLRTLIPIGPGGGSFSGTLTGANGAIGPTQTFEFIVPVGVNELNLELKVADPHVFLQGYLADPQGNPLNGSNNFSIVDGSHLAALEMYRENPQPGTWHFVLSQNSVPGLNAASGTETSQPFSGKVAFDTARVTVPGLPNDPTTVLSSSTPANYNVNITNTGLIPQGYYLDPRLRILQSLPLPALFFPCSPLSDAACPVYFVPTQTNALTFSAQSSIPITMDASDGSVDVFATPKGANTVAANLRAPEVPYGGWGVSIFPVGPFGAAGAPNEPATTSATAMLKAFDLAAHSDDGDFWLSVANGDYYPGVGVEQGVNPTIILPGATGVIQLTISPDPAQLGKTVSGYLYVDTINNDEVVRIPYSYTVGP